MSQRKVPGAGDGLPDIGLAQLRRKALLAGLLGLIALVFLVTGPAHPDGRLPKMMYATGIAFIALASPWLLPERKPAISLLSDPRQYTVEMMVRPNSPMIGRSIEEAGLRHLPGVYLVWALVVLALYYPCRRFARLKETSTDWWIRYL